MAERDPVAWGSKVTVMAQLDPAARLVPQVVVLVNPLVVGLMAMLLILTTEDVPFINVKVWRTLVPTATLPALQEVGARLTTGEAAVKKSAMSIGGDRTLLGFEEAPGNSVKPSASSNSRSTFSS